MRRTPIVALALAVPLALGACGSSSGSGGSAPATTPAATVATSDTTAGTAPVTAPTPVVTYTRGVPANATPTSAGEPFVAWADEGFLYVVTYGSSTCPLLPDSVTYSAADGLTITTLNTGKDRPCTMDLAPTTSTVKAPDGLDDSKDVKASIDGKATTLPAR